VNVVGNDGGFFALAFIPFVTVPLGQGRVSGDSIEGGVGIPWALDVPGWDVGFQSTFSVIHHDVGAGRHAEFANSVSVGHTLVGNLTLSAEFFSSVSTEDRAGWVGTVDTWLTFQVSKNLRLDGGVYIGVTAPADNLHPWIGVTWQY